MKNIENNTSNRFIKATVVVLVIGFGWLQGIDKKYDLTQSIYEVSILNNNCLSSDTVKTDDNEFFNYTKSILKSGIHHLISNYENQ
ncbi:MAG: hypothetical protein ACOYMD_04695 [Paludibacter sp.]